MKPWNSALIAPLLMPVQDRTKNSCQFCSHMITIPIVSAFASGKIPIEQGFNEFLKQEGYRSAFEAEDEYNGPQGRQIFSRGLKWVYPSPPLVIDVCKKRKNDACGPCGKRAKVEECGEC